MVYPRKNPYLRFKKLSDGRIQVSSLWSPMLYTMDTETASFLFKLNGRRDPLQLLPHKSREEVVHTLWSFKSEGLLFSGKRFTRMGKGSYVLSLVFFDTKKLYRKIGRVYNWLLMVLFLPILVTGLYHFASQPHIDYPNSWRTIVLGALIGQIAGTIVHETSHLLAAAAYKKRVYEVGIGLQWLPYYYVLIDQADIKNKFQKIQIDAAGIEANFLSCGFFLLLSRCFHPHTSLFIIAGFTNLFLAVFNMIPNDDSDGQHMIGTIMGVESVSSWRRRFIHHGKRSGRIEAEERIQAMAAYCLSAFQLTSPLIKLFYLLVIIRMVW